MGYFRLALALLVCVDHLTPLNYCGRWAVCGFYWLSGYLITLILHGPYQRRVVAFWANRLIRLWPCYAVVWALGWGWVMVAGPWGPIRQTNLLSFFMLALPKSVGPIPQGWTITAELIFYALLAGGLARRQVVQWALPLSLAAATVAGWTVNTEAYYSFWFPAPLFIAGAATYHLGLRLPRGGGLDRIAGDLSYPLYLCHWLAGAMVDTSVGWGRSWALFAVATPLALAWSWVLVVLIEQPIARLRNRVRQGTFPRNALCHRESR